MVSKIDGGNAYTTPSCNNATFRLARAVGEQGKVVGLDLNSAALGLARQNALEMGFTNTQFVRGDFLMSIGVQSWL